MHQPVVTYVLIAIDLECGNQIGLHTYMRTYTKIHYWKL